MVKIIGCLLMVSALAACENGATSQASSDSTTAAATPIMEIQSSASAPRNSAPQPKPTSYAQYLHAENLAFLRSVDESISGAMIEGNKFKYVGKNVDLHCTVDNVPDKDFFNASCGEDSDGSPAIIVIEYNTHDLSPGQAVRVLGTVAEPMEGNNAMGGEATFPTVRGEFME